MNRARETRRPFQVDANEAGWGGYLVDNDAEGALSLLGRRAALAAASDDRAIVEEAWNGKRTIVTSNGRDFVRYIQEFQRRQNNRDCRDLWGLLVIPNPQIRRQGLTSLLRGLVMRCRWSSAMTRELSIVQRRFRIRVPAHALCCCSITSRFPQLRYPWRSILRR